MLRRKSVSTLFVLLCISVSVVACQPKPASEAAGEEAAPSALEAPGGTRVDPAFLPQLAYDYSFDLSAPDKALGNMMEGHQEACTVAGPGACQVLSLDSETGRQGEALRQTLVLRATPQWINLFRKRLANELTAIGGRIEHQSIATEDLSLSIIEQEAHINNQVALRDNLQATLRTHKGKMSEVVELKQELATIQSEIDATRTAVATMKKRVAMSKLTLTYTTTSAAASRGTLAPLLEAVGGIGPNFVSVLTMLVTLFGYVLPVALVLSPAALWLHHRRKQAKARSATPLL